MDQRTALSSDQRKIKGKRKIPIYIGTSLKTDRKSNEDNI
jgi:hypothetical protein